MKSEIDILIKEAEKEKKYFENYLYYTRKIKKIAEKLLGKSRVFVFGSILKKNEVPQDIDVLIVSQKLKSAAKKTEIRTKIWKKIGFLWPFEIHLITPEEYRNWYKYFIEKKIEIK
jgi:predicted nucleotidyltransferase